MLSPAENLQWPNSVHSVHAIVQGDKNLDGLVGAVRFFVYRTHLAGLFLSEREVVL